MSVTFSRPFRIPFAFRSLALCVALAAAVPAAAQQADEALVGQLAALLAASDARRFDAGAVRQSLANSDPAVRRQAALAAGRSGASGAVDLLVPVLDDSAETVRAAAAFALGLLREPAALPALIAFLRAAPPDSQGLPHVEAVTALAKIGGDEAARALSDLLSGGVRATGAVPPAAAQGLLEAWRLGVRAPVAALVSFVTSPDPRARERAVYSLARLRAPAGAAALLTALQDRDPAVRVAAARGVVRALVDTARLDPRGATDRLRTLLGDRDAPVRILALRSLASFRDSTVAPDVVPLLTDADLGVQVQAESTLGALGGGVAIAALMPRVAGAGFALRRQAVIAVAEADSAAGVAVADDLARDTDWRWRRVAAEALSAAGDRARLAGLLRDADGRVVAEALQGLGRVVPPDDSGTRAAARGLLTHDDPAVRSVAAELLGRAPAMADVPPLVAAYRRAERDPFNDARIAAVQALGAIARIGSEPRLRVVGVFGALPPSDDYLVRRAVAAALPDAAVVWGSPEPIATGRGDAYYRDVARRYLLPGLRGAAPPEVTIETERGTVRVQLLPTEAPLTVAAFLDLVDRRFFDGHRWHRVVPHFVVQDGDPRGDGWGGPGFVLRDELNPVRYQLGTMGMALSGPDTGGSQFFITHSPQPHLDGTYPVFAQVVAGATVLAAVGQGDVIRSIHR